MNRRTFLASTGALSSVVLAGCQGGSGAGDGDPTDDTATATPTGLPDHPALAGIDDQPHLGPAPGDATATIVAFEDPSCPSCRRFEQEVMPQIESDLTSTGTATVVVRGYPVIYPWGEPATRALEGVFAADQAAFWSLWEHYFAEQDAFRSAGPDRVYARTETFLAEETDLDAAGIVERADAGAFDPAVQTDLDAGEAAGAGRTTPHIFLFKDGAYQTKVQGLVGFQLIKSALDL